MPTVCLLREKETRRVFIFHVNSESLFSKTCSRSQQRLQRVRQADLKVHGYGEHLGRWGKPQIGMTGFTLRVKAAFEEGATFSVVAVGETKTFSQRKMPQATWRGTSRPAATSSSARTSPSTAGRLRSSRSSSDQTWTQGDC